jgi:hypothetical protein
LAQYSAESARRNASSAEAAASRSHSPIDTLMRSRWRIGVSAMARRARSARISAW